jgi:hypothetical protein
MKLYIFLFCLTVTGILSAPSSDELETNLTETKISDFIDFLKNETRRGDKKTLFLTLINSVDKKCMLMQYQNFGLLEKIPESPYERLDDFKMIVAADIAAMCSSKGYDILDFFFENIWTHKILLKAFINEPEMKKYKDMMTCANNYAVNNNIIDPTMYPIKHEVNEELMDKCDEFVTIANEHVSYVKMALREKTQRICSVKMVDDVEKFVLKNMLMLQVDVTEAQKNSLKKAFIKDFRQIMEKILKCAAKEPSDSFYDFQENINLI